MDLEVLYEDCIDFTNEMIELISSQSSYAGLKGPFRQLSATYRATGIYHWLLSAELGGLLDGLTNAGAARIEFLQRGPSEEVAVNGERISSYLDPFFDLIASRQISAAKNLGALSSREWHVDYEYEDDYAYANILYEFVRNEKADRRRLKLLINRFETALEGGEAVRLEVCKALYDESPKELQEALELLIEERHAYVEAIADPGVSSSKSYHLQFPANRYLFIEGIALKEVARIIGLHVQHDHLMCPVFPFSDEYEFKPTSFPMLSVAQMSGR